MLWQRSVAVSCQGAQSDFSSVAMICNLTGVALRSHWCTLCISACKQTYGRYLEHYHYWYVWLTTNPQPGGVSNQYFHHKLQLGVVHPIFCSNGFLPKQTWNLCKKSLLLLLITLILYIIFPKYFMCGNFMTLLME